MAVKPIPDGYRSVTPYLRVRNAAKLVEFLKKSFDGRATECHTGDDGTVHHAEVRIGDSMVMVGEASQGKPPIPAGIYLYVTDTDANYKRALAAGATSLLEPSNQFYGDRNAGVKDAFDNEWWIATHVEDVSPEEMERRAKAHMKKT